jgi:uncharacterized protein (DUF2237 family)
MRPLLLLLAASACASASGSPPAASAPGDGPSTCEASTGCTGHAGLPERPGSRNVLGTGLVPCPSRHATGFYRDGHCNTGPDDTGVHVVCAEVTQPFLEFTRSRGNDLVTPRPGFPGLSPGDGWCLCASRWQEAFEAGVAPKVVLGATHQAALRTSRLQDLQAHASAASELKR